MAWPGPGPGPGRELFLSRAQPLRWGCSEHPGRAASQKAGWEPKSGHALEGLGRGQTVRKVGGALRAPSHHQGLHSHLHTDHLLEVVFVWVVLGSAHTFPQAPPGVHGWRGDRGDAVSVRRVSLGEAAYTGAPGESDEGTRGCLLNYE